MRTRKHDADCPHLVGRYLPPDARRADAVAYRCGAVCHAVGKLSSRLRRVRVESAFLGVVLRSMWSDAPVSADPFALLIWMVLSYHPVIPQDLPRKCLGQSQSVPIGAVRASDKPNPAGEALKKARTTEIPQDSCCPSLGWVKSAPIGSVRAADGACGKVLVLSSAQRVLRHIFIVIPAR